MKNLQVDLWYPRLPENPSAIEIDLMDVRASDGIKISYDFERDGWVLSQPTKIMWGPNEEIDPAWKEVCFTPSWRFTENQLNEDN